MSKIKQHYMNGELEDQRAGLVNALYGAKINGKIIDRRKLGLILDYAIGEQDFRFKRVFNKILGL
jgi:hypothetical protein